MSGQTVNSLRLDNVELKGDRPQVCEDIMRGMRNVNGESMGDLIDSYMQVGEFMSSIPADRLDQLIDLRRAATRAIARMAEKSGMDHRAVGSFVGQEFKWREFVVENGGNSEAENYFAAVDEIAASDPSLSDRSAIDVGTYISRKNPHRRNGAVEDDGVFSPRLRGQDYSPVYARDEDNGLNRNHSAANLRLGRGEFLVDTLGVIPSYIIEEHFREELSNSHEYSGGNYDRNNWDTVVAVIGKRDPRTGDILYEDEEKTIPVTEVRVSSYDAHVDGSVAVEGLVNERNNVLIALQAEVDRESERLRQEQVDVANDAEKGYNQLFAKMAAEMGIDLGKVNIKTDMVSNEITSPIKLEIGEDGIPKVRGRGEINSTINIKMASEIKRGPSQKA